MQDMPLHAGIVHLPIGLGVVVPFVALGVALAIRRGWLTRPAWVLVVALQLLVFAGGFVAMRTGGQDEERVEKFVAESAIEAHEERAELFVWLAGASAAAGAAALVLPSGGAALAGTALAVVLSTAAAGVVVSAGHLGGQLVYVQGAARAYAAGASGAGERGGEAGKAQAEAGDDD